MTKPGFYIIRRVRQFKKEVAYFSGLYWYLCGNASPFTDIDIEEVIQEIELNNDEL